MTTEQSTPNFTFEIISPKYGRFTVTAPTRFRTQIEARKWHVMKYPLRAEGREFIVGAIIPHPDGGTYALLDGSGRRGKRKTTLRLHNLVWELAGRPPTKNLDHKDGQSLNNAEDNLRDGTIGNARNIQRTRANTTGVTGVYRVGRKWSAKIRVNRVLLSLGSFSDIAEATRVRDAAALKYHGEFAVLNIKPAAPQDP